MIPERKTTTLLKGDCLQLMKDIPDGSVDMILCDLPYGTTASKWDKIIPFDSLMPIYNRIIKKNGVMCLFGSEPFSSYLRMSNIENYKYDWIWKKTTSTGFQHAKNMPLKNYETISVFSKGSMGHKSLLGDKRMTYNPQGIVRVDRMSKASKTRWGNIVGARPSHKDRFLIEYEHYPTMILEFAKDKNIGHPNQKPVALLEYLIKTYTDEGEVVLDNTMGSGSTGVAAVMTDRNFIGIELDDTYFSIAKKRIEDAKRERDSMLF